MSPRIAAPLAAVVTLTLIGSMAGSALATPTPLAGGPLTIYVGDRGQLQAFRAGTDAGIFYRSTATTGDAGFFLAFPDATPAQLAGHVYGFRGAAGPTGLDDYTPLTQSPTTGAGTAQDPLKQDTTYAVAPTPGTNLAEVTQTTTYVNGTQLFALRWDVKNTSGVALKLKALAAADFFFDGSDRGTGVYTDGPPRFIGGTNADTGNSGGFAELTGGTSTSPPWSQYQALAYGSGATEVWGKVAAAAATTNPTFDNSVSGEPIDNAGGVEWDQFVLAGIPAGATRSFELVVRSAVPAPLQFTSPNNAGSPRGVPINATVRAFNTDGVPYAGRTLRYAITGVNPAAGSVTLDGNGEGTITDPGANAGDDTIVAFVDFNNDGVRQGFEPQASSLATFVDNVAPSCSVKVSGDRPGGGGGAGKPLTITVSCDEPATVAVATTLTARRISARRAAAAAIRTPTKKTRTVKIKLQPAVTTAAPGQSVPVLLTIPKKVRQKYAGKSLKATVTVTAKDASGNVKSVIRSQTIKLARLKKISHKKR